MKKYEKIIKKLESVAIADKQFAYDMIIDISIWRDFKNKNIERIQKSVSVLIKQYPIVSDEYWYFINNYYCPFLGDLDVFLPYTLDQNDENSIDYNIISTNKIIPNNKLLPIGCLANGDYIFLNEKGEVIQFVGIGREKVPPDFFTEVPKDEYDIGWNIAYLTYPDADGLYRMYMVLAFSFDEFMNECVFGDKYPEFTEKEDLFYEYVKKIRKDMNV